MIDRRWKPRSWRRPLRDLARTVKERWFECLMLFLLVIGYGLRFVEIRQDKCRKLEAVTLCKPVKVGR